MAHAALACGILDMGARNGGSMDSMYVRSEEWR